MIICDDTYLNNCHSGYVSVRENHIIGRKAQRMETYVPRRLRSVSYTSPFAIICVLTPARWRWFLIIPRMSYHTISVEPQKKILVCMVLLHSSTHQLIQLNFFCRPKSATRLLCRQCPLWCRCSPGPTVQYRHTGSLEDGNRHPKKTSVCSLCCHIWYIAFLLPTGDGGSYPELWHVAQHPSNLGKKACMFIL